MECGRAEELQQMTPKKLLDELEDREREFHKVTEIVQNHRKTAQNKMCWITRNGEQMREDLEDARTLPGIKDTLDQCDQNPAKNQQATLTTLFSAAEGVSRAKSLAYFDEIKAMKENLREMAKKDEETGTTTVIQCGGQKGLFGNDDAGQNEAGVQDLLAAVQQLDLNAAEAPGDASASAIAVPAAAASAASEAAPERQAVDGAAE